MVNYKYTINPKTSNYSHGGYVHNLIEKAYQGHSFGSGIMPGKLEEVPEMEDIPRVEVNADNYKQHVPNELPKLFRPGSKLAQELIRKNLGRN